MLCNLVSRSFSLFDMKKYLFGRVLPHINSQKLRGNGFDIPFLTPRTVLSTNKTHVYSLLVTFDVLRLEPKQVNVFCAIFRILIHSDPKILQISFLQPFSVKTRSANVIKLTPSQKKFRRVVLQRHSLIPKSIFTGNININTLVALFSFFISNLTCCICAYTIGICHMPLYCHTAIFVLKCC